MGARADLFTISLSVGTGCQARCPYCSIPRLPQHVASGATIVDAATRFIRELWPRFRAFRLRLTGGEIGLASGLPDFVAWVNKTDAIERVRTFTNGELFEHEGLDLSRKFRVYDHPVHDIVGQRWIRYDRETATRTLGDIATLIAERQPRCLRYRCVVVDPGTFGDELRAALTAEGVKIVPRTGPAEIPRPGPPDADERFCHASRYLHVYDVAHDRFFHCCEVKDPNLGRACGSLTEFLTGAPGAPYPQCCGCRTPPSVRPHPNGSAIDALRETPGVTLGSHPARARS